MVFITFARNEVAFTCRQIKQLLRFINESIHLKFVTACELPLFGHFSNSVKINYEMPTRTKTSFPLFYYEQELRQTVLPTFEDVMKSYLLVQHNTKHEREYQQPSMAEKSITELGAPQLNQLWHLASVLTVSETLIVHNIKQYTENCR